MRKAKTILVGALSGALLSGGILLALPLTALGQDDSGEALRRFKALSNVVADQKMAIEELKTRQAELTAMVEEAAKVLVAGLKEARAQGFESRNANLNANKALLNGLDNFARSMQKSMAPKKSSKPAGRRNRR